MSLRTVKKQKLNANADKIRPPPLISDFNSGKFRVNSLFNSVKKSQPVKNVSKHLIEFVLVKMNLFVTRLYTD